MDVVRNEVVVVRKGLALVQSKQMNGESGTVDFDGVSLFPPSVGFGEQDWVASTFRMGRQMTGAIIENPRGENTSERYIRL